MTLSVAVTNIYCSLYAFLGENVFLSTFYYFCPAIQLRNFAFSYRWQCESSFKVKLGFDICIKTSNYWASCISENNAVVQRNFVALKI